MIQENEPKKDLGLGTETKEYTVEETENAIQVFEKIKSFDELEKKLAEI